MYTREEVAQHNTEEDCWVIVGEQVLQLEDFLEDHPGGKAGTLFCINCFFLKIFFLFFFG